MDADDEGLGTHDEDTYCISLQPTKLYVGMEIFTKKEAQRYYNEYAHSVGFGTKVLSNAMSHIIGEYSRFKFVCHSKRGTKKG